MLNNKMFSSPCFTISGVLHTSSISVRDGQSSVTSKGAGRDLHSWRGLTALVLADVYEAHDPLDCLALKTHCQYLLKASIILDIGFENRVQYIVGRQAIGILLVRAQFSRGWLVDY